MATAPAQRPRAWDTYGPVNRMGGGSGCLRNVTSGSSPRSPGGRSEGGRGGATDSDSNTDWRTEAAPPLTAPKRKVWRLNRAYAS